MSSADEIGAMINGDANPAAISLRPYLLVSFVLGDGAEASLEVSGYQIDRMDKLKLVA